MLAKLFSVTLEGIEGILCEVEVDVSTHAIPKPTVSPFNSQQIYLVY